MAKAKAARLRDLLDSDYNKSFCQPEAGSRKRALSKSVPCLPALGGSSKTIDCASERHRANDCATERHGAGSWQLAYDPTKFKIHKTERRQPANFQNCEICVGLTGKQSVKRRKLLKSTADKSKSAKSVKSNKPKKIARSKKLELKPRRHTKHLAPKQHTDFNKIVFVDAKTMPWTPASQESVRLKVAIRRATQRLHAGQNRARNTNTLVYNQMSSRTLPAEPNRLVQPRTVRPRRTALKKVASRLNKYPNVPFCHSPREFMGLGQDYDHQHLWQEQRLQQMHLQQHPQMEYVYNMAPSSRLYNSNVLQLPQPYSESQVYSRPMPRKMYSVPPATHMKKGSRFCGNFYYA